MFFHDFKQLFVFFLLVALTKHVNMNFELKLLHTCKESLIDMFLSLF